MCNCWFTPMMNNIVPWGRDMFGGIPGSMNILYNQCFTDLQARASMWQFPAFGFGLNTYSGMPCTGLEGLLDPRYTWCQQMWNMASGQGSIFGNMGFGNMSNPFWANGFNFGNTQNSSNNEDPLYQKKYNKLLSLLKQLNKSVQDEKIRYDMDQDKREQLEELATKGSKKKTYEEKYEELEDFYKELPKEDIKKFITKDSRDLTFNGKNGDKISVKLYDAGYETTTSAVDENNLVSSMYKALKNKDDSDANISTLMTEVDSYSIMEVLSSYYSTYPIGGTNKDIIEQFLDTYKKITAPVMQQSFKGGFQPVIDALVKEANSVAKGLGDNEKEALTKKADDLSTAYTNWKPNDIKKLFKEVYLMTRLASTRRIEERLKDNYGSIDKDLFTTDSFIMDEVIDDLKKEGFAEGEIEAQKTAVLETTQSSQAGGAAETNPSVTSQEKVAASDDSAEQDEEEAVTHPRMRGYEAFQKLYDSENADKVINRLKSLTKDDVGEFLQSANRKKGYVFYYTGGKAQEGFIEALVDRGGDSFIDEDAIEALLKAVLDCAKEKNKDNSPEYETIKEIYNNIANNKYGDCEDLHDYLKWNYEEPGFWNWKHGRVCETLDYNIYKLLEECGVEQDPRKSTNTNNS